MNAAELNVQLLTAADDLRASLRELEKQARAWAEAERDYKRAKATAYLATHGTVAEREARAEESVNGPRYLRDMAEGLKMSAKEAVQSNRTILSALQTIARLYTEEASFDRTGPG